MASFLLLSCFLVVIALFHSGLRYDSRIESKQIAAMLAERQLERLRLWSETPTPGGSNYDQLLTVYANDHTPASDFAGFELETRSTAQELFAPCSQFEVGMTTTARKLTQSACRVQVTVNWDSGRSSISVSSLISAPVVGLDSPDPVTVLIQPGASLPLDHLATAEFKATTKDAFGRDIPDLLYRWSVVSVDGNGTLTQTRDGSKATLENVVRLGNGDQYFTGGSLFVQAEVRYHGQTVTGKSSPIELKP